MTVKKPIVRASRARPTARPYESPYAHLVDPNIPTPHTKHLAGILAGLDDMTREQIRDERLTERYLK